MGFLIVHCTTMGDSLDLSTFLELVFFDGNMTQKQLEQALGSVYTPRETRVFSFKNAPNKLTELREYHDKLTGNKPNITPEELSNKMRLKYVNYGHIQNNSYPVLLFYHGSKGSEKERKDKRNFKLIPKSMLHFFHGHLDWRKLIKVSSSDLRMVPAKLKTHSGVKNYMYPAFDPRWVVSKWSSSAYGKTAKKNLLPTIQKTPNKNTNKTPIAKKSVDDLHRAPVCSMTVSDLDDLGIPPLTAEEYEATEVTRLPGEVWEEKHLEKIKEYVGAHKSGIAGWDPESLLFTVAGAFHPQEALEHPLHQYCDEFRPLANADSSAELEAAIAENEEYRIKYKTEAGNYFAKLLFMTFQGDTMSHEMFEAIEDRM